MGSKIKIEQLEDINLNDISDISLNSPAIGGEVLVYNDSTGVWENVFNPLNTDPTGNQLISGGASYSGTGLIFDVSTLEYIISGIPFSTIATQVTLATGDPANGRFDAIVADENSNVIVVQGTPGVTPSTPAIGIDQVLVQYILVGANATTPTITTENVYLESTNGWLNKGTLNNPTNTTADFSASTPGPFQGSECVDINSGRYSSNRGIFFSTNSPVSRLDYSVLSVRVYLTEDLTNVPGIGARRLIVRGYGDNTGIGTPGNYIGYRYLDQHGLDYNLLNTWQLITIPTVLMVSNPATSTIGMLVFGLTGNDSPTFTPSNYAMDDIKLQTGYGPSTSITTIDILNEGSVVAPTGKLNFKAGTNIALGVIEDVINNSVDVTINNIGGSTFGTTYFVAPMGNDLTGEIGDIGNPWQTIKGAVTQAVADGLTNPLIYVFPGTYTDKNIQFEGGSFFFSPGAILTGGDQYHGTTGVVTVNQGTQTFTTPGNFESHFNVPGKKFRILGSTGNDGIYTVVSAVNAATNTDIVVAEVIPSAVSDGRLSDAESIFAVGTGLTFISGTAATVVKVYGEVTFDIPATIDGDWPGSVFACYTDADLYVEMHSVKVDQGIGLYSQNNAKVTLSGEFFELTTNGYATSIRDTSDVVLNFQRIICGGSIGIFFRNGSTAGFGGICRVEAEEISCSGGAIPLAFVNVLAGSKIFIDCPDIKQTGTQYAIFNNTQSGGEIYITGNTTAQNCLYVSGSGGYMKIEGDFIVTADGASTAVVLGGNTYINGDFYCESAVNALTQIIAQSSGTLRLNGKLQNPSVGGFGINKTGGTLVLDTVKIISDSDSISATTAQDIKVIHSLAATTAVNANITNAIIGSSIITDAGIE